MILNELEPCVNQEVYCIIMMAFIHCVHMCGAGISKKLIIGTWACTSAYETNLRHGTDLHGITTLKPHKSFQQYQLHGQADRQHPSWKPPRRRCTMARLVMGQPLTESLGDWAGQRRLSAPKTRACPPHCCSWGRHSHAHKRQTQHCPCQAVLLSQQDHHWNPQATLLTQP